MLVDLGRNDIGKISKFGSVEVEKYMSIERYSHVMHIGSTVRGELRDDCSVTDAVDAILPAGTLSGAPKIRACEIINELENNKRGIYGGAIGYIDFTGNLDTCIAIRIAYKKNGKVFVRSGAGIVADSVPENEYQECIYKAKADNYDSFSYNLYQLIGMIRPDIRVIRNDEMTIAEIEALAPDHIIVSPGPGRPKEAGICEEVIDYFKGKIPIFGVCLGHQAICETFGGEIGYAKKLMHGKMSIVDLDTDSAIFKGMEPKLQAARYHSLAAEEDKLPAELKVIARTEDGEIMAVEHRNYPVYGVQFHPESILTPDGRKIMERFLSMK